MSIGTERETEPSIAPHQNDIVCIQDASGVDVDIFTVCIRDEKGKPTVLQDTDGSYCDLKGKPLDRDVLGFLASMGAIG